MAKKFISIDLGAKNIKLVIGSEKNGIYAIDKMDMIPTPSDAYSDGKLLDSDTITKTVQSIILENGINQKNVSLTINSTTIITREISLPAARSEDLDNMVQYEIGQYLPIEMNQYVVEYKLIEEYVEDNVKKNKIFIAAVPKHLVDSYYNFIKQLNLYPYAMDIHSNAVSKLFTGKIRINDGHTASDKNIAVLDIGCKSINVSLISKGKLKFNRLINQGSSDIDMNIANVFNIPFEEAEKRKLNGSILRLIGEVNESDNMLFEAAKNVVDFWVQDIQRIFQFFESRNTNSRIEEVYLYGGGANLKGLSEYMKAAMNMPVDSIISLSSIKLPKAQDASKVDIKFYLNAIGAIAKSR